MFVIKFYILKGLLISIRFFIRMSEGTALLDKSSND